VCTIPINLLRSRSHGSGLRSGSASRKRRSRSLHGTGYSRPFLERVSVPLKKADLLTIAQYLLASVPYNRLPLLAKRHKLEIEKNSVSPVEVLLKHLARYDESDLSRFLLETSLLEQAYQNGRNPDNDLLLITAKRYRVDAG
jgi:hypothetical protein